MDGDGFLNAQQTLHIAPANADTNYDNCPTVYNPSQLNTDGNLIDLSPPKAFDDITLIRSDALGDACDTDDDNDGRSDADEISGAGTGCFGHTSNPLLADTDDDRALDGAECSIGTDPLSTASVPTVAQCGATTDADGDLIPTFREYCYYGSDPNNANSDGDGCGDGREMASINGDNAVSPIDQSQIAQALDSTHSAPTHTSMTSI